MKIIPLTQGQVAVVDDRDYERISAFKWSAVFIGGRWYAKRSENNGKNCGTVYMHRQILVPERGVQVRWIDGDSLNNVRSNFRQKED